MYGRRRGRRGGRKNSWSAIKNVAWRRTHCRETGTDQQASKQAKQQATGRLLESGDFEARVTTQMFRTTRGKSPSRSIVRIYSRGDNPYARVSNTEKGNLGQWLKVANHDARRSFWAVFFFQILCNHDGSGDIYNSISMPNY